MSVARTSMHASAPPTDLHEAGGSVVSGLYRLIKSCALYDDANDTVSQARKVLTTSVKKYCAIVDAEQMSILFAQDTVFVEGRMLLVSRETHELARELGVLLAARGGINQITLGREVLPTEVEGFARLVMQATKDPTLDAMLTEPTFRGITAQKAKLFVPDAIATDDTPGDRCARTYATAVVCTRAMYNQMKQGTMHVPPRITRIAQRIVLESEKHRQMMSALVATLATQRDQRGDRGPCDPAEVAVGTAIIAVCTASLFARSRTDLTAMALTSMLMDTGRRRFVMRQGAADAVDRPLSEEEHDRMAASSAVAFIALGKLYPAARARCTLAYESMWRKRAHRLGAIYRGRRKPHALSRVLHVARMFVEQLCTAGSGGVDEVLNMMLARTTDATDRMLVRALIGALGIFPCGTLVELSSKQVGVVVRIPDRPIDFPRPTVRILYDPYGERLAAPFEMDLLKEGEHLFVRNIFSPDPRQEEVLRPLVLEAQSKARLRTDLIADGEGSTRPPIRASIPAKGWTVPAPSAPKAPSARAGQSSATRPPPHVTRSIPPAAPPTPAPPAPAAISVVAPPAPIQIASASATQEPKQLSLFASSVAPPPCASVAASQDVVGASEADSAANLVSVAPGPAPRPKLDSDTSTRRRTITSHSSIAASRLTSRPVPNALPREEPGDGRLELIEVVSVRPSDAGAKPCVPPPADVADVACDPFDPPTDRDVLLAQYVSDMSELRPSATRESSRPPNATTEPPTNGRSRRP